MATEKFVLVPARRSGLIGCPTRLLMVLFLKGFAFFMTVRVETIVPV
jgi:hypothetical protein